MPDPIKFGKIDVNLVSSMQEGRSVPDEDTPFRMIVLGDFSGRANRGMVDSGIELRKPLPVDRDNIDDVLAKLHVEISLPVLGKDAAPVRLTFAEMEDFHPDRLYNRLEIFDAIRDMKKGLKDPALMAALIGEEPAPPVAKEEPPSEPEPASGGLLDQILDDAHAGRAPAKAKPFAGEPGMQKFLKDITEPHLVAKAHPKQAEMMASVDDAAGEVLRRILHAPDFQAFESLWRGLHFLTMRLDTDENLKIYLLDVSKAELAADLLSSDDLVQTGVYQILAGKAVKTFGGEPWAVVAGQYSFSEEPEDIRLLGRLGKIAMVAGAPFLAAANDTVLGCRSLAETPDPYAWKETQMHAYWNMLRSMPEAGWLGLGLPRFLLRLPYGEKTDPVESFPFEEMPVSVHEHYLWGNPALASAYLLGRAFLEDGWHLRPGQVTDLDGLPLHVYKEDGESVAKPCAEVALTEKAAERILDQGLLLFLSYKNQDVVRLARFQSLADPPANLGGKWG